jgi:hypothetical protein
MKKLVLVLLYSATAMGCTGPQLTSNDKSQSAVFKAAADIDYIKPMEGAPTK